MYCPRCSQQQTADELRFCSRCGFPLESLRELLANDGTLATTPQAATQASKLWFRRKKTRQGAKLIFLSIVLMAPALAASIVFDSPGPFILPFTLFLAGLAWMVYFLIFGEDSSTAAAGKQPSELSAAHGFALPPMQSIPLTDFKTPRTNTAEMIRPSVTEHTTKLLDNEPQ